MLLSLETRLTRDLDVIRALIRINEEVRSRSSTDFAALAPGVTVPASADWRIFDHSGVVTRLYALYERFLEDAIAEWLTYVPVLWPNYSDLNERLRRTHREGVGRILGRLHYRRYRHLDPVTLLDSLKGGLTGSGAYSLPPEPFIDGDRNYQPEVLRELFGAVGLENVWGWVEAHRFVTGYLSRYAEQDQSLEVAVKNFVEYRNDAAHGAIDQVLGVDLMLELVALVEALCAALAEAVRDQIMDGYSALGHVREVGKITEVFRKAGAVVALCAPGQIAVGDELTLRGASMCRVARVESVQIGGSPHESITIALPSEVGLKLGTDIRENLMLVRVTDPGI